MGDLTMISTVWAVSLACLGYVVFRQSGHQVDTTAWTVIVDGAAWGSAAVAMHVAAQRFLAGTAAAEAVAQLATVADRLERWPEGLAPCMPLIARALDAERALILAGSSGSALEPVGTYPPDAGVHPALATGAARALDGDRIIDNGELVFIPRRTASGLDVVIVTRQAAHHRVRFDMAVTVSQLIAGIVDRASLIGSLRELAMTDPLTGLPNRRSMFESLDRFVAIAARNAEPFSVAMVDLDHFKDYNDRFGHQAGDRILRELGAAFATGIRHQDLVGKEPDPRHQRADADRPRGGGERSEQRPGRDRRARRLAHRPQVVEAEHPVEAQLLGPARGGQGCVGPVPELREGGTDPHRSRPPRCGGPGTWDGSGGSGGSGGTALTRRLRPGT